MPRDKKRKRGEASMEIRSSLVGYLLSLWSWGLISTPMVQAIAKHAKADIEKITGQMCPCEQINVVAGLGGDGSYAGNMKRDLVRYLSDLSHVETTLVDIPVCDSSGANPRWSKLKVLLPHVLFANMFNNYPKAFASKICRGPTQLQSWWKSMRGNPQLVGHPLLARTGFARRAIPIRLHGDGVAITGVGKSWAKTATVHSWCSMLASGASQKFNWHIWSCFSVIMSEELATRTVFWKILCWSLYWLYLGLWPDRDWNGVLLTGVIDVARALQPLAGGPDDFFFCVVFGLLADLEHFWKEYGLNSYNSNDPCFCCPARNTPGPMSTNEMRPDVAAWVSNLYTKEQWIDSEYNRHEIFSLPGVTILTCCVDLMHTKYLGVDSYFNASVLVLLVYYVLPHSPTQNLNTVWKSLKRNMIATKSTSTLQRLTLSMFSKKNYESNMPFCKSKASAMKGLARALLITFSELARIVPALPETQLHQIKLALRYSAIVDEIIDDHKEVNKFGATVYATFKDAGFKYMILFNALGKYYSEEHVPAMKLFDVTIKAHMLLHCILQAEFINPRIGWCYYGEDFMQKVQMLLQVSCLSNAPSKAMNEMGLRYSIALHLLFTEIHEGLVH